MEHVLLFILLGLGSGALIAGLAVGVVLTFRGSGIISLAMGGYAMLAGYAFWGLTVGQFGFRVGQAPALVIALAFVMFVVAVAELVVFRPLRNSAPLAKLVASLGLLLVLQATLLIAFGTAPQNEPQFLPQHAIPMLGAVIPVNRFIIAGIVVAATLAVAALYRWTRFGLSTRAASENELSGMLSGLSPTRLALANSLLAALIAGAVGILAAAITELDTSTLPLQIVPALAAALIAGMSSPTLACFAGFGIGILYSLLNYFSGMSWFPTSDGIALPGVTDLLAFLLVVAAMFLRGARLPGRGHLVERRLPEVPRPRRMLSIALPIAAACAVALVVLPYDFRQALTNSEIGTVMALSLVVITGFVGQISVVQLSLAGVTGFIISHLAVNAGIGFPLAPIAGVAAAVVLGLATAVSALRVRGVSLVVVTLAGAVAIQNFYFLNPVFGGGNTGSPVPDPHLFGLDLGSNSPFRGLDGNIPSPVFGWVALASALAMCVFVAYLRRGGIGQRMLAVRSNERASAAVAINARNVKLIAFGASSFVAGVAGVLYAYNFGSVSSDRFDAFTALSLIAFAYAGGITLVSGAVFAGVISTQALFPYALDKWFGLNGNYFLLFGGVILIITLLQNPEGVMGAFYRQTHRKPQITPPPRPARATATPHASRAPRDLESAPAVLAANGVSVDFGGVHALRDVSFEVREGELVGLIGPNGAGKTTFVDAVTGFVRCSGEVSLDGRAISSLPAHKRAELGLARTWQSGELFEDLLVEENLAVAQDRSAAWRVAFRTRTDESAIEETLTLFDLSWAAKASPADLSQGHRKLVGVARALAARPRVLLLDEPAAGLDTRESEELGAHLRAVADAGQSTLLIDHDMGLVLSICDRVVVLEFGRVIADGPPEEVRTNPRVVSAYLGGAEIELGVADAEVTPELAAPPPPRISVAEAPAEAVAPAGDVVLEIANVSAGYDDIPVVRDLSMTVSAGEVVALMGANGAGKTTTLRAISGIVKLTAGTIKLAGENLEGATPTARTVRGISHVPEGRGIFYGLTVAEHFRLLPRREQGEVAVVLEYFPALQELQDRRAGLLSGGEQQMLAIACALARKPKLLLLDELSLGLAPVIVERLLPIVREIADTGRTAVVLVEQHVRLGLEIADRVYVLAHGELTASGTAEELRGNTELLVASYLGELRGH